MGIGRIARRIANLTSSNLRRRKLPHDPARAWLGFVNPGMLDPGNVYLMDHCIRRLPDAGAVVEIGSFSGLSLNHLIHFLKASDRPNPVFSVDEWMFEGVRAGTIPRTRIDAAGYRAHVIESFRRNVSFFSGDRLPHHVERSSDEFFALWERGETVPDFFGGSVTLGGPIAMAYIDGDHTYGQSRRDFLNVDRHLVSGGFVLFDDSADWSGWGSHRTAREAARRGDYELVMKAPNYLLRKR